MNLSTKPAIQPVRSDEEVSAEVLRIEAQALLAMADELPPGISAAVDLILAAKGRVIVSGMGKSGHIARKIAATLSSTGTPAIFIHPAEASHGDLGMITPDDICILLSNSGETRELQDILLYTRRFGIPLVGITKAADSSLARTSDIALLLPDAPEACAIGMAPTTSTTCALALGDVLAIVLMHRRGFSATSFQIFHPGGKLGAQFLRADDLMHRGDKLPVVGSGDAMGQALLEMSAKGFGIAAVVDDGRLVGVITDGDLRRNLDGLMERSAGEVATAAPRTITPDTLASEALRLMNERNITALLVVAADGELSGLVHIHDCLRAGVA